MVVKFVLKVKAEESCKKPKPPAVAGLGAPPPTTIVATSVSPGSNGGASSVDNAVPMQS